LPRPPCALLRVRLRPVLPTYAASRTLDPRSCVSRVSRSLATSCVLCVPCVAYSLALSLLPLPSRARCLCAVLYVARRVTTTSSGLASANLSSSSSCPGHTPGRLGGSQPRPSCVLRRWRTIAVAPTRVVVVVVVALVAAIAVRSVPSALLATACHRARPHSATRVPTEGQTLAPGVPSNRVGSPCL